MKNYEDYEKLLDWEESFNESSRQKNGKPFGKLKKKVSAPPAAMSDFIDDTSLWVPSYAKALDPQHHEREWLND